MGCHENISFKKYPKQSEYLGHKVKVCFYYDTSKYVYGVIVRDDRESPGTTLIRLDDGRYVNSTECQYSWVY